MIKLVTGLVLILGAAACPAFAGPLAPLPATSGQPAQMIDIGCDVVIDKPLASSDRHVRRSGNCNRQPENATSDTVRKYVNRRIVDCHRDVRTHRVGGVMLKHRHVGDDCDIREVRTVN